jgi:hypothetical protein
MGGLFGYIFGYLGAYNQGIPKTVEQFALCLGVAGASAGIITGILGILVPYIIMPQIMKVQLMQKVVSSSRTLKKIVDFFSKKE